MEMRIYEFLGIKYWKKFVLWISCLLCPEPCYRKGGNYWLQNRSVASAKNFKNQLFLNALVHIFAILATNIPFFINNMLESNIAGIIFQVAWFLINSYCIMLQRYNWLRIKKILKKVSYLKIVSLDNC